jgi:hypothetical protein
LTDIVFRGRNVPDCKTQYEFPVQCGSGKERTAAGVDAIEQLAIVSV